LDDDADAASTGRLVPLVLGRLVSALVAGRCISRLLPSDSVSTTWDT
jgi:hypothetical protein